MLSRTLVPIIDGSDPVVGNYTGHPAMHSNSKSVGKSVEETS